MLTLHLFNGCHKNIFAHYLVNPNDCIENVSLIIVTNHMKSKML